MFTKEQISAATARVRTGADYPRLVQELKQLGVRNYEHVVSDGVNIYYGEDRHFVTVGHSHELIAVADKCSAEKLRHSLSVHQQGETSYPVFCVQAGEAGVAKWVSDLEAMEVRYLDRTGRVLLSEPIPLAEKRD